MVKRIVTITSENIKLGDEINEFISNELNNGEYVIDIKIMESGRSAQTKESYLVGGGTWTHQTVYYTAYIYVGEILL